MRKRDFGVLLIAAFAVYYTLQEGQGPFSFRKAWCASHCMRCSLLCTRTAGMTLVPVASGQHVR